MFRSLLRLAPFALLALALSLSGCKKEVEPQTDPILETVDLPPPPTFDPDSDPRAATRSPRLAGALPGGFPDDLPIHLPASVTDFGDLPKGWAAVSLTSPDPAARVRELLVAGLRTRGWSGGDGRWRKGEREIQLEIESDGAGTRYRYVYRKW